MCAVPQTAGPGLGQDRAPVTEIHARGSTNGRSKTGDPGVAGPRPKIDD
jgi:hypothetical protein